MSRFYVGVFFALASAAGFGLMPIFGLYAYVYNLGINTILFLRFAFAALVFFVYTFMRIKDGFLLSRFQFLALFLLGGILYTAQAAFYFLAIRFIPASLTALLIYTYPILVTILSAAVEKEKPSRQIIASICVAFAGLILVLGTSFRSIDIRGVLSAFGAATVYSVYIVLGNRVVKELHPVVMSAFVSLFASLSFLCMGLVTSTLDFGFHPRAWLPIAGIIVFSTLLAVFGFFRSLELIGSTRASILSMIEPLVTVGFAALLFSERLSLTQLLGGAGVLAGAMMLVLAQRSRTSKECNRAS
ncbi:MAG: DMT family transporter [Bacillota bacterium]